MCTLVSATRIITYVTYLGCIWSSEFVGEKGENSDFLAKEAASQLGVRLMLRPSKLSIV